MYKFLSECQLNFISCSFCWKMVLYWYNYKVGFILLYLLMKSIVKYWVFGLFLACFGVITPCTYADSGDNAGAETWGIATWWTTGETWWVVTTYTVNFVTNGGWTLEAQIITGWEKLDTSVISVHRDGFSFSGWFIDSNFKTWFDIENDVVTSDLTLYAKWREHRIRVIYHANWWVDLSSWKPVSDLLKYTWKWVEYLNYNWTTWKYKDWAPNYTSKNSTWHLKKRWHVWHDHRLIWSTWADAKKLQASKSFSYNWNVAEVAWMLEEFKVWDIVMHLYADWTPVNYTLTYTWLEDCTFENGENPATYTVLSWNITLNNPSKTWYTFLWRSGTDIEWLSTWVVITWDSIGNRVFEAVWQINSYSITYDIDWSNKIIVTWDYNTGVVQPQDPVRNWYRFLWWDTETPANMPADNIVITAKWEKLWYSWAWRRSSSTKDDSDDWSDKIDDNKKSEDDSKSDDTWNQDKNSGSGTGENLEGSDWKIDMDDLMKVYLWARDNWITTWETLEAALPDGYIERWEMAKLVVDFVQDVLKREIPANIPSQCSRWDNETEWKSAEVKKYAEQSCALWLMWIYMQNFKPNKLLDRAEFGTIVSRLLWWDKFNKPNATRFNKFYTNHLEEVKKQNLITKIDNPEAMKELRKWIWTVLKKIDK